MGRRFRSAIIKSFYSSHSQPRHREVVGRALLSCSLIFGADMIECGRRRKESDIGESIF